MIQTVYSDELYHHGIKGQKWGVRRWQNPDGSLTEEGKRHYGVNDLNARDRSMLKGKTSKEIQKMANREARNSMRYIGAANGDGRKEAKQIVEKYLNDKYGSEVASKAIKNSKAAQARGMAISSALMAFTVAELATIATTGNTIGENAYKHISSTRQDSRINPKFKSNGNKFQYNASTNSFTGTYRDLGYVKESTALAIRPRTGSYRR